MQLVVSDKPGCGGWQYAEQQGIATLHYNPKDKTCPPASQVVEQLQAAGIDYVALAGYLKVGTQTIVCHLDTHLPCKPDHLWSGGLQMMATYSTCMARLLSSCRMW